MSFGLIPTFILFCVAMWLFARWVRNRHDALVEKADNVGTEREKEEDVELGEDDKELVRLALSDRAVANSLLQHGTSGDNAFATDEEMPAKTWIEEGIYKGRRWRRYEDGTIEGERSAGNFTRFNGLREFLKTVG